MATEARSNPNFTHNNHHHHRGTPRLGMRSHLTRHSRTDSGQSGSFRCTSPSACWRDVSELVDLATQTYLFDRERGATDPLYVAEELAMLKGAESGIRSDGVEGGSDCKGCARAFESWAKKERERLWRSIPTWFKLD